MNTGKLNRRVTIITPGVMTPATDGLGGFTEGTQTTRETWAAIKQLSMREQLLYGLETGTRVYQFRFKYFAADDITRVKELQYDSRNFRIASIDEIDLAKQEIVIIAHERTN